MGIIKEQLASVDLSDEKTIEIEDNVNGKIHIHINDLRIEFSKDEFDQFKKIIIEARNELDDLKDDL